MSSNHKKIFNYYCNNELKYITEERDYNSPPTVCKNDGAHTIKYITVSYGDFCVYNDDTQIPERFDLSSLDYANMSAECKKLLEIIRSLLICAEKRGLLEFR